MLSQDKISDIAEQVGFADVRTFINTFKKRYGMTPLQYKKSAAKRAWLRAHHRDAKQNPTQPDRIGAIRQDWVHPQNLREALIN